MKVMSAILFLTVAAAASAFNFCPKIQKIDWQIELLLPHWMCSKFYQCTHGQPVEMTCPKGLYFNFIKQKCDWRDLVECGDRITPDLLPEGERIPIANENSSPSGIVEPMRPDASGIEFLQNGCPVDFSIHWLLPHLKFCNLFYYCENGKKELRRCPFWLHFNRKLQVCDWPQDAGCLQRT